MVINALDNWKWASKDVRSRDWRKVYPFFQCGYNNLERLSTP